MPICQQLKTELDTIAALAAEFDAAFDHAKETGDMAEAKALKARIEEQMASLKEKLWPFRELPRQELEKQYQSHQEILKKTGILERFSTGGEPGLPRSSPETMVWGIKGIDNKEYPFPSFETILRLMRENKEVMREKQAQGFTRLLITPFGMKLEDLAETYKQAVLKHHREGTLFYTRKDPKDETEALEPVALHDDCETNPDHAPLWVWDTYNNADTTGALVYHPQEFSRKNHRGTTKRELLTSAGGWHIQLIEDLPNIPRKDQGKTIGGRPRLDTAGSSITPYIKQGKTVPSPQEYLTALHQDPRYRHEHGMTPEDQLAYAILHLEQTNQVIDNYQGNGSISYQLGAYFPASGAVPYACWYRDGRQARLGRLDPGGRDGVCGVRSGVRVLKP
ncbi:hypothetical protein A3C91_01535 [Candidatus Azambacteria bacterium RIFCSPHIGHO2_02_FULL_52_12]|uniref:Uncharacterized protein n=1 Tax=Candidatus Azambacteria bacterium RIFCSPLOWO2_01_FULL_46_25 TaxID=1797298 RepID=A0A1F5BTU1_9BACT|nr:MAG: hypothetical protein A3C91_01535 [Candidatus Azambacteria bacterium RIFCSPHIGHO2_02_FULL_52_12]OGD34025.1 MAG: hypothetical protein A2988_00890 [Candidatus Azambacteria bacterium RIFCSPLOWO2_01_FULL_46_25]OGD36553.1 MAG: hypothetical protein A2850_02220 [Candidatus Azambacteria bacterium RIFCSPHIGHO2_01_FULL_51_74]